MTRKLSSKFLLPLFLLPLTLALAEPTSQENLCPAIVRQALVELGDNCNLLDRNSVCYGFKQVRATFSEPQPDDYFSEVSDTSSLTIVDTLATTPLNVDSSTWGVAVMKVQANVPNSLPGQAVVFILLGDTEVRNEVSLDETFIPADPVEVTVGGGVNIRSGPSVRSNILGSTTDGTILPADGRSEDGGWLRVLFQNTSGWISAELVDAPEAVDALPTLTNDLRTPMQTFYLRTGIGTIVCDDAPNLLMIQGPKNLTVDLTVNGADVQIGSTIVLMSNESTFGDLLNDPELMSQFGGQLNNQNAPGDLTCNITQIIVIDGGADINDGGSSLPTGFTARSIKCGGAGRTGGFMTSWGGSRPLTGEELAFLQTLNNLPPEVLNYPIRVPTSRDIQAILQAFNSGGGGNTVISGPAAAKVNCTTLRPTSPLGGMPGEATPFYWDAAAGATSYTVRVYDSGGALVGEYSVNAPQTTLTANPPGSASLSWDVSAYVDGQLACTSSRATVIRDVVHESAPPPSPQNILVCHYWIDSPPNCPPGCTQVGMCVEPWMSQPPTFHSWDYLCSCPP
jgi:hypothetical protein